MIVLKSEDELALMRASGRLVAEILDAIEEATKPGVSTWDLEEIADKLVTQANATAAFKGYRVGNLVFPCCLCTSVNEEVVHGIPSRERVLEEGDLLSVDFGVLLDGFYGDAARSIKVGKVDSETEELADTTREALEAGISQMVVGKRLSDIGAAVQDTAERRGYSVVRQFVGHGIGRALHEEPQVPNFGRPGRGSRLRPGMVLAIEPMINVGTYEVETLEDGWTVVTVDRKLSAHFEQTIAVTDEGPRILTAR